MSSNEMPVEEARKRLGDLVIAAMRGETTVITRYGKPAADLAPHKEPVMNRQDLTAQITATLGDNPEDFDIEAIVDEVSGDFPDASSIDDIDSEEYWEIVNRHDRTIRREAAEKLLQPDTLMLISRAILAAKDNTSAHVENLREIQQERGGDQSEGITANLAKVKSYEEVVDLISTYLDGPQD